MKRLLAALTLLLCAPSMHATNPQYLYKVTLVQAAPGKLMELIDLYKARFAAYQAVGDEGPLWMRHSQGDHWDLMILYPISSYAEYYQPERVAKRKKADESMAASLERIKNDIAWQEDLFVYGPAIADLRPGFSSGAYFHVEMFIALPGQFAGLYQERQMENAYSQALREPINYIFVRDQGAAWDLFTIGVYRDLKDYAESADVPVKDQEAAAKAAGFDSPTQIGPYLRRFISTHHDTLAVAVK